MARVVDLLPGDLVTVPGSNIGGIFIARAPNPRYPGLQLVIWKLSDGKMSFDALYMSQDIGRITPSTGEERGARLLDALDAPK